VFCSPSLLPLVLLIQLCQDEESHGYGFMLITLIFGYLASFVHASVLPNVVHILVQWLHNDKGIILHIFMILHVILSDNSLACLTLWHSLMV